MGHRAARLHRVGDEPLLHEALPDDDFGVVERAVGVAIGELPVERLIAGRFVVQLRRASGQRLLCVGDDGQRLVVDVDQVERVGAMAGVSAMTAATPSPVKRTGSMASAWYGGVLRSDSGMSHAVGIGLTLPGRSLPVMTA